MKLVTFREKGAEPAIGALCHDDRSIVAFAEARARTGAGPSKWFADMLALMDGGDAALDTARTLVERSVRGELGPLVDTGSVELMAPVPVPRSIRDCLSFEKHFRQAREGRMRALVA